MAAGEISKHFGDQGDPAWKRFNPKDLVEAGKLDKKKRVLVDIGAQDPYFLEDNLRFADALDKQGAKYELKIWDGDGKAEKKHNWDTWSGLLSSWVAFHQETFGKPGQVVTEGVHDVAKALRAEKAAAQKKHEAELRARVGKLMSELPVISEADKQQSLIVYSEPRRSVVRPLAELARNVEELKASRTCTCSRRVCRRWKDRSRSWRPACAARADRSSVQPCSAHRRSPVRSTRFPALPRPISRRRSPSSPS
jgi:hypothetical protein